MHFSFEFVFEIEVIFEVQSVNDHGIQLGIDPSDLRPTSIDPLEHLPEGLAQWDNINKEMHAWFYIFLVLRQQWKVVNFWRTCDPVLISLLGQTIFAKSFFLFRLSIDFERYLITVVDLHILDPYKEPFHADQVNNIAFVDVQLQNEQLIFRCGGVRFPQGVIAY